MDKNFPEDRVQYIADYDYHYGEMVDADYARKLFEKLSKVREIVEASGHSGQCELMWDSGDTCTCFKSKIEELFSA